MGDFFPGGWQLDFNLLKHDAGTYSKSQETQPANCAGGAPAWFSTSLSAAI
jgi:hypothetical protein